MYRLFTRYIIIPLGDLELLAAARAIVDRGFFESQKREYHWRAHFAAHK